MCMFVRVCACEGVKGMYISLVPGILPPILSAGGLFALAHSDKPDGDNQNHPILLPNHTCMVLATYKGTSACT